LRKQVILLTCKAIHFLRDWSLALACCALPATIVPAQSISGKITGVVTDPSGAIVRDAEVSVINEATSGQRRATANENGYYVIPELPVGFYTLKVEVPNFAPATMPHVKVDIGAETRVDIALTLQAVELVVNASAEAPLLRPDSSTLAEFISNQQVEALPVNGRDFRRLTTLGAGSAPRSQRGSLGSFTVNGQREKANIFLLDGVDNNDSFRNQPSFNQGGVTGAPATLFPIDALGEFSVQTQSPAEYGRNSGAIVNIAIKSGTNGFHGSAYEFLRNDNLDARNTFETQKGEFRNNNFGGVLGGPIVRNRTFFFGGYEGQREFVFSPGVVRVPGAVDLANARDANTAMRRDENPLSTRILELFPKPNFNLTATTGNNYAFAAPNTNDNDNFLIKIDHHFSDRFNLSGRYVYGDGNQTFPLTSGNGSPLPPYQTAVPTRVQLFGLNFAQNLSPRLINETRIGYNRFVQTFTPLDADFDPASIGLITGSLSLPTITIPGFVSLGAPTNVPRGRVSSGYQLVDNLTRMHGAHTFKIGVEYRRAIVNSFSFPR
jgi:hypothetical protein